MSIYYLDLANMFYISIIRQNMFSVGFSIKLKPDVIVLMQKAYSIHYYALEIKWSEAIAIKSLSVSLYVCPQTSTLSVTFDMYTVQCSYWVCIFLKASAFIWFQCWPSSFPDLPCTYDPWMTQMGLGCRWGWLIYPKHMLFVLCFQLGNTKAQDGKSTLLNFIANIAETKHPDIVSFHEELSHVDKAARGQCCQIPYIQSCL